MDPAILKQLAVGALVPGFFATTLFALAWLPRQPETGGPRSFVQWVGYWTGELVVPWALSLVYIASHPVVFSMPETLRTSFERLPIAAVLLIPLGFTAAFARWWSVVWSVRLFTLLVLALSIGATLSAWDDPARLSVLTIGLFVLLAWVSATSTSRLMKRTSGTASALLLLIPAAGASQLLVLGFHSLKLGQAAGIGAAVAGGALAVSLLRRGRSLHPVGETLSVFTMFTLLHGVLFTETPYAWLLAALVAISPAVALLVDLTPLRGVRATLGRIVLAGVPLAVAFGIALAQKIGAASDY